MQGKHFICYLYMLISDECRLNKYIDFNRLYRRNSTKWCKISQIKNSHTQLTFIRVVKFLDLSLNT
jgi:hypothetical protein